MTPQETAEKISRTRRTAFERGDASAMSLTMSVSVLSSPAPAAGCAACAYSARAEKGKCKQPSEDEMNGRAAGTALTVQKRNMPQVRCQTSDKMELRPHPCFASLQYGAWR